MAEEGQDTRAGLVIISVVTGNYIGRYQRSKRDPWCQCSESHPREDWSALMNNAVYLVTATLAAHASPSRSTYV